MPEVPITDVQHDLESFVPTKLKPEDRYWMDLYTLDTKNLEIQIQDNSWRVSARKWFAWVFFALLVLQNIVVFGLVGFAYFQGRLAELAIIFSILTSATLVETYLVIKIIVEWIFHDIKYDVHGKTRKNKEE